MLVILIAVLIAAILMYISFKLDEGEILFVFSLFIFIFGIIIGIFMPTDYKEWELIKRTEIVTLSNSTETQGGGFLYVSVSGENVYTYRYEIESEFGTDYSTEYEVDTVSGKVIESEDPNCKVPELLKYMRRGKATTWTFGVGCEIKYVFHVPEGTISHEVKLK